MTRFWRDRPTLVTGATGFLGGALVRELAARGAAVVGLVRDWVPDAEVVAEGLLGRVAVVRGDVRDRALLERIMGEYEVDTVLHLAAQTAVTIANRNPLSTFETNVRGTWARLEAARRSPTVRQVVLASSDKAYGSHERLPYHEAVPLQGRHPYDVSKSCADLIAQAYAATYRCPVAITRCANLYGGGDLTWNRLVPGSIRSAIRGERPVIRSDGTSVRDYLYVEDAVSAYLTLAEALAGRRELAGEAFNFGNNRPVTVLEMVRHVLAACERRDLVPDIRADAAHEIPRQYLDATRAHRELGWQARFSHEEGLRCAVPWYRRYLERGSAR
ncbi:MAG: NAD-dependent epimerase/dehydratase family protein [Candidatus Rokuibacteriota bacterium]